MSLIENSIKYMFNDEEWIKKAAIGGIISIIPFVNFIIYGYFIDVIKYSIENKEQLPEFNYIEQFIKGIIVLIVFITPAFIYYIIFLILIVGMSFLSNSNDLGGIFFIFFMILYVLFFIILFITYILLFIGLTVYADTGNIYSIFNISKIFRILKNTIIDQIIFLIVFYIILTILSMVAYILAIICFFTIILIPVGIWIFGILAYYSLVTLGYFYGKIYLKGLNKI